MMLLGKTIVITGISSGIGARVGELAVALGADIVGVDVNFPARPLDPFIKADIGSAQGVAEIVEALPRRFDALCNVAGVSGMIGAKKTLAINFYGLRELTEALAPRLREGARSSTSLRSPATAGAPISSAPRRSQPRPGSPISGRSSPRIRSRTGRLIRCRRSCFCCGRCGPRTSRCSRIADCASTR
jgi:NAD(P)-dependent dehydrogenase (short-subunit alcohol dehydrogenase family)